MNLVDVIILGLATWRISSLLTEERGPFDIFVWIRELSGITHDENKEVAEIPDGFFPQLLSCVWCVSIWVGLLISVAYFTLWYIAVWISFPFALSAMAIILSKYSKV